MAKGLDALTDFLLAEIALCGVQGAGSAEFCRFIKKYHDEESQDDTTQSFKSPTPEGLGRAYCERLWDWATKHPDIRIVYQNKTQHYTFSEFEAIEKQELKESAAASKISTIAPDSTTSGDAFQIAPALSTLGQDLRQRIFAENLAVPSSTILTYDASTHLRPERQRRILPPATRSILPLFDDPDSSVTAPRLYASQNRTWQALTGHGIDLKKVPNMEFVLLSIIASRGAEGIAQPELTQLSGQDKRSVPNRTNELARKGYITKEPVQANKIRTSLCVHSKFAPQRSFLTSAAVEDVYKKDSFVLSGFVHLLYSKLKDSGIVPTRDIRPKLGVPMTTWNKRATQGALIRLDQTGMIKRFRVRKKKSLDNWLTCIRVLREPREEDVKNLGFRRQPTAIDDHIDELLDEDLDGDILMRDLEVDLLEAPDGTEPITQQSSEDVSRIAPQWTPDRMLANIAFDVVFAAGTSGLDSIMLRNLIVGSFWRRPMEAYMTRMTDDWEKTQPLSLRHLAIIRDSHNTEEKKFLHYVFRTFQHFQKVVDSGVASWQGVSRSKISIDHAEGPGAGQDSNIDSWGFATIKSKDLFQGSGSASLSEARSAIVHRRAYGPRYDRDIRQDIGHEKSPRPPMKYKNATKAKPKANLKTTKPAAIPKNTSFTSVSVEQRRALGLRETGRLAKHVEEQIIAHRRETGDPMSVPDHIIEQQPTLPKKPAPLMTAEERIAQGLPPKGRLGKAAENKIREERGLPKLPDKAKKQAKRALIKEPTLLSKKQRLSFGWTGHGRLPQDLIEGLRREREEGIPIDQSEVIPTYMEFMRAKANNAPLPDRPPSMLQNQVTQQLPSSMTSQGHDEGEPEGRTDEPENIREESMLSHEKRKAHETPNSPFTPKRLRTISPGLSAATAGIDDVAPTACILSDVQKTSHITSDQSQSSIGPVITGLVSGHESVIDDGDSRSMENAPIPKTWNAIPAAEAVQNSLPEQIGHHVSTPSRPSPTLVLLPDTSTLSPEDQSLVEQYSARSSDGIYLNPFAKYVARGRPRKALVATFRLRQLHAQSWFKAIDDRQDQSLISNAGKANAKTHQAKSLSTGSEGMAHSIRTVSTTLPTVESSSETDAQIDDVQNANRRPVALEAGTSEATESSSYSHAHLGPHNDCQLITEQQSTKPSTNPDPSTNTSVAQLVNASSPVSTAIDDHSHSQLGKVRATDKDGIQAQMDAPASVESDNADDEHRAADITSNAASRDLADTIAEEVPSPARPKSKRAKKPSTVGSALLFRQKIIRDIIDMCGGVFPDQGEIGRPFSTLWDQRFGNLPEMRKPLASTVNDILRTMCTKPEESGLKRMHFNIKTKHASRVLKKNIITYTHFTAKSPEVLRMAYNIANKALPSSNQFFPEQIRHLVDDTSFYLPTPAAPKEEGIVLSNLTPEMERKAKAARLRAHRQAQKQKVAEAEAGAIQTARVERPLSMVTPNVKRARLASLNDRTQRYRRAPQRKVNGEDQDDQSNVNLDGIGSSFARRIPLVWVQPWVGHTVYEDNQPVERDSSQENDDSLRQSDESAVPLAEPRLMDAFTSGLPLTCNTTAGQENDDLVVTATKETEPAPKTKKRVRIAEPAQRLARKKPRLDVVTADEPTVFDHSNESDDYIPGSHTESSSSSQSEVESSESDEARASAKSKRRRTYNGSQRGKRGPLPTLLERLTGLTGNPNDPVYKPPRREQERRIRPLRTRTRNRNMSTSVRKEHNYFETLDPVDAFHRFVCTLVVATSLSSDNTPDWTIVEKAYSTDKLFDLTKSKKISFWMRSNMTEELVQLQTSFQSMFLDAYQHGKVAPIQDPGTYDWTSLVRWVMRKCVYPQLPLPILKEALQHFQVEESIYEHMDRSKWFRDKMADRSRVLVQIQNSFVAPLHHSKELSWSTEDKVLKARSWTRSNTATPEALYNGKQAHDKLMSLGNSLLSSVVGDLVERQHLRMRKLKRLLPGRNFLFTHAYAKKFGRQFELGEFINAVEAKKRMDVAFTSDDPEQQFYNISRIEEDGANMAILTLLEQGQIRLVPKLPPVNSSFDAPLPRLSVWGFCEGDYKHRAIDRSRLFWDVHVVPTATYRFGNPLQPTVEQIISPNTDQLIDWPALPPPPMPGKSNCNALLPVWSSIDGQAVIWPWWYRILNLVLQPFIFQPGATPTDIYRHCYEHTIELFEVELVLGWLESLGGVKKTIGGGYLIQPGFWAAFGDRLLDVENDTFGEHVKRKAKNHELQQWRANINLQHASLQGQRLAATDRAKVMSRDEGMQQADVGSSVSTRHILENPKQQYRVTHQVLTAFQPPGAGENKSSGNTAGPTKAGPAEQNPMFSNGSRSSVSTPASDMATPEDDAEPMDVDAEGDLDDDAEGESDYEGL